MIARVFVDTNVLVYARDRTEPAKQRDALSWLDRLWRTRSGRLSYQVLQEFYVTVTRKLDPGMSESEAREDVVALFAWQPIAVDSRVVQSAWVFQDRYRLSWWDALIAAAAARAGCRYLLSEDLQHGQSLDGVEILSPFEASPSTIG